MTMSSPQKKLRLAGAFAVLAIFAVTLGCRGFFVNPTLTTVTAGPTGFNLPVGSTQQMTATGTYNDGSTKTLTSGVVWTSSDPTVATVTAGGLVTGVAAGTATITAQSGTITGTAAITVALTNVTGLTITPTTANVKTNGGTVTFKAFATISGSSTPIDVSAQANWSITNQTADYSLTQGVSPETVTTITTVPIGQIDTLTATYTSGTTQFTATAKVLVTQ
jgi:Big-like domain-containing protein